MKVEYNNLYVEFYQQIIHKKQKNNEVMRLDYMCNNLLLRLFVRPVEFAISTINEKPNFHLIYKQNNLSSNEIT